jgi:hypothetical protein
MEARRVPFEAPQDGGKGVRALGYEKDRLWRGKNVGEIAA